MQKRTLEYLEAHQSTVPSRWRETAQWRRENRQWLRYSRRIAVELLSYMQKERLTQSGMAELLGCSQQYVSRILKGTENLTLETIARIENATGIKVLAE